MYTKEVMKCPIMQHIKYTAHLSHVHSSLKNKYKDNIYLHKYDIKHHRLA